LPILTATTTTCAATTEGESIYGNSSAHFEQQIYEAVSKSKNLFVKRVRSSRSAVRRFANER